jgi:flagellar biosynthesis/type III secretory pathway chaperone
MELYSDRLYIKLEANLEEITKLYRQLVDQLRKEKEVLLSGDPEKINESTKTKEFILMRLKTLDALRIKYASDLARELGLDADQPRLLEIARELNGERGAKLRGIHSALEILFKRIPELNKENEEFVQSGLKTLHGALENVKDNLTGKKTYQRKGNLERGSEQSGHLMSKEA